MATVYVVQETPGRNLLPATKFGEIKILLPPGQIIFSSAPVVQRLRRELRTFSNEDYLLMIGDPAAIAVAGAMASYINGGRMKLLKWDKQEQTYFSIDINLHGRLTDE